jgi:hypothetical protein
MPQLKFSKPNQHTPNADVCIVIQGRSVKWQLHYSEYVISKWTLEFQPVHDHTVSNGIKFLAQFKHGIQKHVTLKIYPMQYILLM